MQGGLWQPGWLELLREKRSQGLSCGEIAVQMSEELHVAFTRNSVIGKLNRERIQAPARLTTIESRMMLQHRRGKRRKTKGVAMTLPVSPPTLVLVNSSTPSPLPATTPLPTPTPDEPQPCLLMDLPDHTCRWPVNQPTSWKDSHLFCGKPTDRMQPPYCEEHYEQSVVHVRAYREPAVTPD